MGPRHQRSLSRDVYKQCGHHKCQQQPVATNIRADTLQNKLRKQVTRRGSAGEVVHFRFMLGQRLQAGLLSLRGAVAINRLRYLMWETIWRGE